MSTELTLADISVFNGEPTIVDLKLAELLGYEDQHKIRDLIKRNIEELQQYGDLFSATVAENNRSRGRPGTEFHLSEPQALVIATLSKTENAALVRKALITIFLEWRNGTLLQRRPEPPPMFEIDIQHAPLSAKTEYLRLVARLRGREAAVAMMPHIGLPDIDMIMAGVHIAPDGEQCLAHLLSWRDDRGLTVREMAAEALHRGEAITRHLRPLGLRAVPDGEPGLAIAINPRCTALLFQQTKWDKGAHVASLRGLPGVSPLRTMKFDGIASGALFVPAHLLKLASLQQVSEQ